MEDLICPACGEELDIEEDITKSLVCPYCKTKWQQPQYQDFLEMLLYEDIIDDIDFSALETYGGKIDEELLNMDEEDSMPGSSATKHDTFRDSFDEFENDAELHQQRTGTVSDDDWDIFSDDVALEEDWDDSPDEEEADSKKRKKDKADEENND